jgi:biopolymer transport protein ExbB
VQPDGELDALLGVLPARHALRRLMTPLLQHSARPVWWIEEQASALALDVQRDMSRGLWVLETIVTAAPLVGLLGTIVGMMHAFRLIGGDGLVNPTGVTGGVAQALVATALGLVIALVALFAFNYFSRRIDRLVEELETFTSAWLADIRLAREQAAASSAAESAASAPVSAAAAATAASGAAAVKMGTSRTVGAKP